MSGELTELHLADLHAKAAEAGVEGYRMLGRDELIQRIEGGGERPKRRRGRRGGRRARERLADGDAPARERRERAPRDDGPADGEPEVTEEITGVLEITRQRHGFLRIEGSDDDVYVSASQVRRCELRAGDEVTGPARAPRRGERHRALVHVDGVNGRPPQEEGRRDFEDLTPARPSRRIELGPEASTLVRSVDRLAPLAYGQRVLVRAEPRSGRTTLLRELAVAISAVAEVKPIVLLIDERPEELPAWKEALPEADLALAPADLAPRDQVRVATQALERALRAAEAGSDIVVICDSLSRLAVAADGVAEVKRLFGSGRETAEDDSGSLTVIATVFSDGADEKGAERAVATTETSLVTLDGGLAADGIVPALAFAECRAVGESTLLSDAERADLRELRADLAALEPPEAAALLNEKLG